MSQSSRKRDRPLVASTPTAAHDKYGSGVRLGSLGVGLMGVFLMVAPACGRSTSSGGGTQVVAGAAASLSSVGTSRVSMATSAAAQPGVASSSAMEGVYDFRANVGELHAASSAPDAGQSFVIVDGRVYSRLPAPFDEKLPGKHWIVQGLPKRRDQRGSAIGSLVGPFGGVDPGSILTGLSPVVTKTVKLGRDRVRDVEVTQYEVVVDVKRDKVKGSAPPSSSSSSLPNQLGPRHPVHIWIDDDGRARRVEVPLVVPANPTSRKEVVFTYTVEYWDFGIPVNVVAPPAAEVATFDEWRNAPCPPGDQQVGPGACTTTASTFVLKPRP